MKTDSTLRTLPTLALALALVGCASHPALETGLRMQAEGRTEDSALHLAQAMRQAPDDRELRAQYFRQRDLAVAQLIAAADSERAARRPEAAAELYRRVLVLDSAQPRAREGLAELATQQRQAAQARDTAARAAAAPPTPAPTPAPATVAGINFSKPITLEFRDLPIRSVFEVIARSSGINFVFDRDVRADTRVTIFMRNTAIEDVVRVLLVTNQLERKLLNENTLLIYPNTPAKAREYVELVTRSFYLANADVKQAQALVRTLVKTRDIFVDEKLNLLVIKDTPAAVSLAERLLATLDIAEPEVMLEVEVLEITRSKLQELGLRFPDQIGYGLLQPSTTSTIVNSGVTQTSTELGGTLAPGFVDLRNRGAMTSFVTNPALLLNLRNQVGDGNLLANPRIRVRNREKARIHIGDKLPVFTTTSTANVGVSASVAYLDVGLKLDVEANVYLDDEVAIKVGMEVSSVVREVAGPANSLAYQVGTRSAATVLRLRNGETQVLAGLISDEERSSANRLPGLGGVPFLGRLFSSQRDNSSKTEIVLLITPRIVRNLARPEAFSAPFPAGSELSIGAPLAPLRRADPGSMSLSSSPGGPNRGLPEAPAAPEPVLTPAPAEAQGAVPEPAPAAVPAAAPAAAPVEPAVPTVPPAAAPIPAVIGAPPRMTP